MTEKSVKRRETKPTIELMVVIKIGIPNSEKLSLIALLGASPCFRFS